MTRLEFEKLNHSIIPKKLRALNYWVIKCEVCGMQFACFGENYYNFTITNPYHIPNDTEIPTCTEAVMDIALK